MLPLLSAKPAVTFPTKLHTLAGTKLYCLVTEAHRCEQLAQGCYAALPRVGFEPMTCWSQVQCSNRCSTVPPYWPYNHKDVENNPYILQVLCAHPLLPSTDLVCICRLIMCIHSRRWILMPQCRWRCLCHHKFHWNCSRTSWDMVFRELDLTGMYWHWPLTCRI